MLIPTRAMLGSNGDCGHRGMLAVSLLTVVAQVGTTIGLGPLSDTLVIRAFVTPSVAALLGKWFWWSQHVRQRTVPEPWSAAGPPKTKPWYEHGEQMIDLRAAR